ncbi:PTS sugar transporter subunit IIB [Clostridium intestinale]|jgi:PTS system cellobiose-specific IIB component|uniref:PTS system, cellobiose-specific IIB component n=1 Tax=Clostridium intestinale DSM 6191 TaxID=1121320 RepID=A0A1M5XU64_9CLOT|nr:PTS sugar transporter subunit IIB [Clostridium intestinale]SHI03340.1 PTS system, cellobiose-specific IIB component [Clostridium intestinale DSM 6191]
MKILLVCAGGMSTSILMKKMESYWKEAGEELEIKAVGLADYQDVYTQYDIVMMGPQVSYRLKEVKENTGLPCAQIESFDYAIANCPNIMKLAKKLYSEK